MVGGLSPAQTRWGKPDRSHGRPSAYTGSYTLTGSHIDYADDSGFTATGDIRDGVLHHQHLALHREDTHA
ncbi:Atu4866 domain-containing protein [Streptomyces sp. NPDC006530]|uniref:Atu4866 domain-containing protein n=1 Tax=Streptomyces sp. NPDC006530 TaxID=3364750 RepID=UPI0036B7CB04